MKKMCAEKHTVDCSNVPVGEYGAGDQNEALKKLTKEQRMYLKRLRKEWKFERIDGSGNIIFSNNHDDVIEEIEFHRNGFFTVQYIPR